MELENAMDDSAFKSDGKEHRKLFYFQPSIDDEAKDVNLMAELILTSKEEINLQSVKCFVNKELFLMFCAHQ